MEMSEPPLLPCNNGVANSDGSVKVNTRAGVRIEEESSPSTWPHAHARSLLFALNAMRENGGVGCDVRLRIDASSSAPVSNISSEMSSSDSADLLFDEHGRDAGTLAAASSADQSRSLPPSERHRQTPTPPHLPLSGHEPNHPDICLWAHSVVLAAASAPFRRALEKSTACSARLASSDKPQSASFSLAMGISNLRVNRLSDAERRAFPQFLDALYGAPLPPPLASADSANDVDGARFVSVF
jgi:hypothetical protein